MSAIRKAIEDHRSLVDAADDLGEITVTVKLNAGTMWIRGVEWKEERICRRPR